MRCRVLLLAAALVILLAALPAAAQDTVTVRTNTDLRLRARPSTRSSAVLAVVPQGVELEVTGINARHTWVQATYYGFTGWLYTRYLTVVSGDLSALPVTDGTAADSGGDAGGEAPPAATPQPADAAEPAPLPAVPAGQTYDCPRFCRDYTSCEQALYCLAQGATRLDRDGDGSPCEQPEYVCPAR